MSEDGRSYLRNRKFLKRAIQPADGIMHALPEGQRMNAPLEGQGAADPVSETRAEAEKPRRSLRVAARLAQSVESRDKEKSAKKVSFVDQ